MSAAKPLYGFAPFRVEAFRLAASIELSTRSRIQSSRRMSFVIISTKNDFVGVAPACGRSVDCDTTGGAPVFAITRRLARFPAPRLPSATTASVNLGECCFKQLEIIQADSESAMLPTHLAQLGTPMGQLGMSTSATLLSCTTSHVRGSRLTSQTLYWSGHCVPVEASSSPTPGSPVPSSYAPPAAPRGAIIDPPSTNAGVSHVPTSPPHVLFPTKFQPSAP